MAVPTFYYRFLDTAGVSPRRPGAGGNVRLFTCGSAPIRPEVLPGLEAILGRPVINRYGMTEAHVITSLPLDGPWPQGSVGLPLDGDRAALAARRRHAGVRPARSGRSGCAGPNLFREYWRNPEATQRRVRHRLVRHRRPGDAWTPPAS